VVNTAGSRPDGSRPAATWFLSVADRLAQVLDVVGELAQTAVAVEAENATYVTEHMIVVNMLGVGHATDRANAALLGQKLPKLLLADAVATPQVVAVGAVAPTKVMTRLAISPEAGSTEAVTRRSSAPPRERDRPTYPLFLLSALLDVATDKFLRVLLEDRVDFVEQIVDVLTQLLVALGCFGTGLGGRRLVDLFVAAGTAGLRLPTGFTSCHARGLL
jgi:hypothetical protein